MLNTLKAILATAGIVFVIGVVVALIPVMAAIISGIGALLLFCLMAGVIYSGIKDTYDK